MPNGDGLTAVLQPFFHSQTGTIHGDRCFLRLNYTQIFTAFLVPEYHPPNIYMEPRVFIRMSNHNHTLYSGYLQDLDGYRPEWLF